MVQTQTKKDAVASDTAGGGGGISLGKGAWDCDRNVEIPPEAEVGAKTGLESDASTALLLSMSTARQATVAYVQQKT